MKFTTNKEQRDFFYKHSFVEFADVLTQEQVTALCDEANKIVANRLKLSVRGIDAQAPGDLYLNGRDLWRESDIISKSVCARSLAQIAAELFDTKPLRFGYDQFYMAGGTLPQENGSLLEASSMQGVVGGALIALTDSEKDPEVLSIFPSQAGNISFFKPSLILNFEELATRSTGKFLMFVYTKSKTMYILQEKDPHTHCFKRLGYVFGDKLNEESHPIVYS